jgi:hypothetical protein
VVAIFLELYDNTSLYKKISLIYHSCFPVFEELIANALPLYCSFDHAINLKDVEHSC